MKPQLHLEGLTKAFEGHCVVQEASLEVGSGEIVALLGPSGCGKTTLLRCVAGLEHPEAGRVFIDGEPVDELPPEARGVGLLFQSLALFPHLDVGANVAFGLRLAEARRRTPTGRLEALARWLCRVVIAALPPLRRRLQPPVPHARRVAELLETVGLAGYQERKVDTLSGGEAQRVALARALAPEPRVLLLDEPLSSLDRGLRESLRRELRAILKRVGVTALYVTHDQAEAAAVADRVALMRAGRIVQVDSPASLYQAPADTWAARFLGLENLLPAKIIGDGATDDGYIKVKTSLPLAEPLRVPLPSALGAANPGPPAASRAEAAEGAWELLLPPAALGLAVARAGEESRGLADREPLRGVEALELEGTVAEVEAGPRSRVWVEVAQEGGGPPLRLSVEAGAGGGEATATMGLPEVGGRVQLWLVPERARLVRAGT